MVPVGFAARRAPVGARQRRTRRIANGNGRKTREGIMSETIISVEQLPTAAPGPIPPSFEHVVEAFCIQQADFRARLARSWDGAACPLEGRNGKVVTDNGGHGDGQE